jgi:translation initiation factor 5
MEGQKLNIPSYVQDTNYRYQMPVMKLKIEGRGKNIRTNIENMVDISKALNVNTEYPLKFIGIELGSRIIYEKNGNDITTSLKGVFQYDDI